MGIGYTHDPSGTAGKKENRALGRLWEKRKGVVVFY
jgi:hypothetical protein